jgi:hypothetical protein
MNDAKYIGLDVHQATISVAILDSAGKLVMEAILETKSATILQFICGLRGSLHVTFEEGTWAAWLHDLLKPHVSEVLVCDPRKNNLGKVGSRNIALSLSSEFTAENEVAARMGELYVNNGGVCGRLTLKPKSRRAKLVDA